MSSIELDGSLDRISSLLSRFPELDVSDPE